MEPNQNRNDQHKAEIPYWISQLAYKVRPDSEIPPPRGPSKAQTKERFLAAGYPLRSYNDLGAISGASERGARQIMPRIMGDGLAIILGPTGRGKTGIATWLAMERDKVGLGIGKFITAYSLFARMKTCWTKGEDSEAVLAGWKKARFLVIDEIQTRAESAWENAVLDELLNARYSAQLPSLLIGNLTLAAAQTALGPRILDRATESGGILECSWKNYR